MRRERRSSTRGITPGATLDARQGTATARPPGGRQTDPPPPRQGGGYQDSCNTPARAVGASARAARDPRIEELRRVGIGRVWIRVAEAVGFEDFLRVWHVLASDTSVQDERSRVLVPSPTRYQLYQRNQLIKTLAGAGAELEAICERVRRELGETLTPKRVKRLLRDRLADPVASGDARGSRAGEPAAS